VITAIAFVVAAAIGAVVRGEVGRRWNRADGRALGTLVVNVIGAFLLGVLADSGTSTATMTVLGVGGLGAFTTFSSFARDVVAAVEVHRLVVAAAYAVLTIVGGVLAAALGLHFA